MQKVKSISGLAPALNDALNTPTINSERITLNTQIMDSSALIPYRELSTKSHWSAPGVLVPGSPCIAPFRP